MMVKANRSVNRRRGAALVELAIVLPVLTVLAVVTVDAARLFFHHLTIINCARNGALYESDSASPLRATYSDYKQAALADAQSLSPALTTADISSASGSDSGGATVSVTVQYQFPLLTSYLGFTTISLSSTVTMRVASVVPN